MTGPAHAPPSTVCAAAASCPDWREPDVIRAAPVPFYNRYDDAWRFVDALHAELGGPTAN